MKETMKAGNNTEPDEWDVLIKPHGKLAHVDLKSVWRYRDLVMVFVLRDFVTHYKQTILGPLWYLIQPTVTAGTYYVVFGKIANLSTNGIPPFLFYMSGIVLWTYFSSCLTGNSEVFSKNANLFSKVYFPRLVVPISVAISGLVAFCVQFTLLLAVTISFIVVGDGVVLPGWSLFALPLLVLYVAALGVGVGLIVSALTVRFRDLVFATGFAVQLWMYSSPVIYSLQQIPPHYRYIFYFNPMSAPLENMRHVMFGAPSVPLDLWVSNGLVVLALICTGLVLFTRSESSAMDTV
jgi:lipopolysaccharide transport system permease protein